MREVAHSRQGSFLQNLKTLRVEFTPPLVFQTKRAWAGAPVPLQVVSPANKAVPPKLRNIFINDHHATWSEHTTHLSEYCRQIMGMMQYVTKNDAGE